MAMVTSLAPKIGYDRAAEIAKESARTGKTVREICREKKVLPEDELNRALDPVAMTEPGRLRLRRRMNVTIRQRFPSSAFAAIAIAAIRFCSRRRTLTSRRSSTRSEAESILGEKIKDLTPVNVEGKDGYYSKCSYYSVKPGKSLVIRVQQPDADAIGRTRSSSCSPRAYRP